MINYKTYADMSEAIRRNLPIIAAEGFDLIVGVPRSGMAPAYMIGLYLNTAVCSINDLAGDHDIRRYGSTRSIKSSIRRPSSARKILIVDDSYNTGKSLAAQLATLSPSVRSRAKTMVIYAATDKPALDFYLELLPQPRVFEWNIFHHEGTLARSCFDLDGVLCEDPADEQNDDGKKYLHFVKNAQPKFIPTHKIKTIITSRLEKYRRPTEAWLRRNGIKYENLIMLSGYTAEERRRRGIHPIFKAEEYRKDEYVLFVESNRGQSKVISKLAHKPVYCVDSNVMVYPEPEPPQATSRLKDALKRQKRLYRLLAPPYKLYKAARARVR